MSSVSCSTVSPMRHMASASHRAATATALVPLAPRTGAAASRRQMGPHKTTLRPLQARPEAAKAAAVVAQGVYEVRGAQIPQQEDLAPLFSSHRLLPPYPPARLLIPSRNTPAATPQATGVPLVDSLMQMATVDAALQHSLRLVAIAAAGVLVGTLVLRTIDRITGGSLGESGFNPIAVGVASTLKPAAVSGNGWVLGGWAVGRRCHSQRGSSTGSPWGASAGPLRVSGPALSSQLSAPCSHCPFRMPTRCCCRRRCCPSTAWHMLPQWCLRWPRWRQPR